MSGLIEATHEACFSHVQTKALDEALRGAEARLSTANSQLSALGQALGASSSADLQAALEARLAELSDAGSSLRDVRRQLQVQAGHLPFTVLHTDPRALRRTPLAVTLFAQLMIQLAAT